MSDAPNPNWKINKFRKYLAKCGKYKYKAMYYVMSNFSRAGGLIEQANFPLMGRVFKSRDAAIKFAAKYRLLKDSGPVWLYEWSGNEWVDINSEASKS